MVSSVSLHFIHLSFPVQLQFESFTVSPQNGPVLRSIVAVFLCVIIVSFRMKYVPFIYAFLLLLLYTFLELSTEKRRYLGLLKCFSISTQYDLFHSNNVLKKTKVRQGLVYCLLTTHCKCLRKSNIVVMKEKYYCSI